MYVVHIHTPIHQGKAPQWGAQISAALKAVGGIVSVYRCFVIFMLNSDSGLNAHKFTARVHSRVSTESQAICYPHSRLWRRMSINLCMNY